jgi:predicted enzyme related to lactoylglutathione lyase
LDWSATDLPAGDTGTYTKLDKAGKSVCVLDQMPAEIGGTPPHWLSVCCVSDVDASSEQAQTLGGKLRQSPCDVMDNEPNTLCWNELQMKDPAQAADFYTQLFDWTTKASKNAQGGVYGISARWPVWRWHG